MNNLIVLNTNIPLIQYQVECVSSALEQKRIILSVDTGCGKSYIMTSIINNLSTIAHLTNKKIVITLPTKMVDEVYNLILSTTRLPSHSVAKLNGETSKVLNLIKNLSNTTVIVTTHSAWQNLYFSCLMNNLSKTNLVMALLCDECSVKENEALTVMLNLASHIEYVVYSNATPVNSRTDNLSENKQKFMLLYKLLYSLQYYWLSYNDFCRKYVENKGTSTSPNYLLDTDSFTQDFSKVFINVNRDDFGVEIKYNKIIFHRCQGESTLKDDLYYKTFNLSSPSISSVLKIVQENFNKKILLYIRRIDLMDKFKNLFETMGIRTLILNGSNTDSVLSIQEEFKKLQSGVIVTNFIEGINLGTADVVISYSFPSDILQLVARTVRGLVDKAIDLHFIYYPITDKEDLKAICNQLHTVSSLFNRNDILLTEFRKELEQVEKFYQ